MNLQFNYVSGITFLIINLDNHLIQMYLKIAHKKSAQEALLVNYVGTDYPKYDLRILLLEF